MRKNTHKDIYILSMDGGGIRGVIPVMVLQELERILADSGTPRPVSSCFDLVAGTSTGGLIALALAAPYDRLNLDFESGELPRREHIQKNVSIIDMYKLRFRANHQIPEEPEEGPLPAAAEEPVQESSPQAPSSLRSRIRDYLHSRYRDKSRTLQNEAVELSKILAIYEEQGERIFPKSSFRQLQAIGQMFGDKYDVASLERLLDTIFSDLTMQEATLPVVVTTYDCYGGNPYLISSYGNRQYTMRDAARATSAAPTYFSPLMASPIGREDELHCLIDGGVCVNNPSLVAYLEAKKLFPDAGHFHILSLGTAAARYSLSRDEFIGGGMIGWLDPAKNFPLYQSMTTSQYGLTDYALNSLPDVSYHRIDGTQGTRHIRLDDAGEENITRLKGIGQEVIRTYRDQLTRFCDELLTRTQGERY